MYALNGIIESGNSDWSVEVTIENCHTGNAVAQGVLPGELRIEWLSKKDVVADSEM